MSPVLAACVAEDPLQLPPANAGTVPRASTNPRTTKRFMMTSKVVIFVAGIRLLMG